MELVIESILNKNFQSDIFSGFEAFDSIGVDIHAIYINNIIKIAKKSIVKYSANVKN